MSDEKKTPGYFPPLPPDLRSRNRFAVVVEEMTEQIAPVMKPPLPATREEPVRFPRLFPQVVRVFNGAVESCPRCGNAAFEPGIVQGVLSVTCRGCPPPPPVFTLDLDVGLTLKTNQYRCSSCGKHSKVTMVLREVNLYCGGCQKLAIHETFVARAGIVVKEN